MASDGRDPSSFGYDLLRRVTDELSAMLSYWDSNQQCCFANRAYGRWAGASPESLIGRHISELLGPSYPLDLPYIEGALRGEPQEFEREVRSPAGGPPQHSLASYLPDMVDGIVRGFFALVTDTSEMKRAELALEESEARFSGIIAISADAIISIDEEQRITMFNDSAEKIFGYTKAEVMGDRLDMLLPARLREQHTRYVESFMAGSDPACPIGEQTATVVGLRRNGEEFPADAAISKLEVGGKLLLTVALRDITERNRLEMEQRILAEAGGVFASSLDYKQTLASIAKLIVHHLADFCIVDTVEDHGNMLRLTVAHADPAMASVCEELAALHLEPRHTLAWSALETKQIQVFHDLTPELLESIARDEEHLRLVHELAPRSAIVAPLLSGSEVLGAIAFVSKRPNRYGASDVGLATELARRAAMAIENARLLEREQRAKQARDEVLAIVAHDVRSPLSSILLAASALKEQLVETGAMTDERSLRIILRGVQRANRLIEDLLDVARIDAGVFSVALHRLDARAVAVDVVGSLKQLAAAASVELQLQIGDDLPALWGDPDRLHQILENLIGNAIKFTPRDGRIIVRVAPRQEDVLFSVTDTGPGIPAESLSHIFDRFWQANRAERRGAGLGLAICNGLVEAHGGRLWVESKPGHGSTFFFTIPVAPVAPVAPRAERRRHKTAPSA